MLSRVLIPLNKAMFWKVRDALFSRFVHLHLLAVFALEEDVTLLGMVNAVDDVEHGALTGTIGADN